MTITAKVVTTESMIERVARHVERQWHPEWTSEEFEIWWRHDPLFCERVTTWPDGFRGTRKQHRMFEARAAIEAMREPTDAMLREAEGIVVGWDDFAVGDGSIYLGIPGYPDKTKRVWRKLVDAILDEQESRE